MMDMPCTGSATTTGPVTGGGSVTSSQEPALTLSDLGRGKPSTRASPDSTRVAAAVRDNPKSRDTAWSSRIPSSPSGTGRLRLVTEPPGRGLVAVAPARTAGASRARSRRFSLLAYDPATVALTAGEFQQNREDHAHREATVRDVENGKFLPVRGERADHVDHMTAERARRTEQPIGQVPQGPAEHHPERDRPRHRPQ